MARGGQARGWLGRALVACVTVVASTVGLTGLATAAPPTALIEATCTTAVSYGDEVDCQAASIDENGNYGVPGTFTFDAGDVLPATWSTQTCAFTGTENCAVSAQVATPPGAEPRTFDVTVSFVGSDGSTASTTISVAVSLRTTTTTVDCGDPDQPFGTTAHCVMSVTDGPDAGLTTLPSLPSGVAGLSAKSSGPGDVVTYDTPSADGSTCVAVAAGDSLSCGFSVAFGTMRGLRTLTGSYPGDPAADELASQGSAPMSNGIRALPLVSLSCPDSVQAEAPQVSCHVMVSASDAAAGGPVPSGTVTLDQAYGQPLPLPDPAPASCTLVAGACTIAYEIVEGPSYPPVPVRALYSGDDAYKPGSDSENVAIIPTRTVATLSCDSARAAAAGAMHCQLSVSTAAGQPVPVSPRDALLVSSTSGTITCDQFAAQGCGHVTTATAAVAGFTVHLGQVLGPQQLYGQYTGDDFAMVASASTSFAFTTVPPALLNTRPPGGGDKVSTRTSVSCGPAAYKHAARCTVKVVSAGGVPTGSVVFASAGAGHAAFAPRSCTLGAGARCAVSITVPVRPGAVTKLTATYSGSARFLGSVGAGHVAVRAIATTTAVHCSRARVAAGALVHCVASVRTEFGGPPSAPVSRPAQVTASARGDAIRYDGGGRACHWKVAGHALTCGFSVKTGRHSGVRTVRAYYWGSPSAHDAASRGLARLTVVKT